MSKTIKTYLIVCVYLSLFSSNIQAVEHDPLDVIVRISKNRGTVYELLKDVSHQSGYQLIYDSSIIDNDKKVNVTKGEYSLRNAIYLITSDKNLRIDLSGGYILLRRGEKRIDAEIKESNLGEDQIANFIISGRVSDAESNEAVTFASVGVMNAFLGTITNHEGDFRLVIPDSLRSHKVRFSHIGYKSIEIDLALLEGEVVDLKLQPAISLLKEVIVSPVIPEMLLNDMIKNLSSNYASEPVCLTTFYREGVNHNNRNIEITESILQLYKTGYKRNSTADHVKLIKKRRVKNSFKRDSMLPKLRSGISSCLLLDIIKEMPEFITPDKNTQYTYSYTGKTVIDDRLVNIISFRQKEIINDPLYTGHIYIEDKKKALVEVHFEVNPKFVDQATYIYVDRYPRGAKIELQQAQYIVSYKLSDDGYYYISHIRGDLRFKMREKGQLFSSVVHLWFEMVTCDIATEDVEDIPVKERLSKTQIFSETKHDYDKNFWKNFNIILPEEALKENMIKNISEVVIMVDE